MLGDESLNTLVRVREELEASPEDQIAELAQRMQRETRRPKPDRPRIPVLVTGSASHIERVARELDGTAIEAVAMETIRIEPVSEAKPEPLPDVDWVVITSPNAVPFVESYVKEAVTSGAQVAVVGSSTADALNQAGVQPNLVGDRDGEHLAQLLVKQGVMGSTVVCLVSNIARPELPSTLESAGAKVITKVVYRTEPVSGIDDRVRARIETGEFAAVMFASPSSVESVVGLLGSSLPALSGASLLAIGETTANQMRAFDLPVHGVAEQPNPGAFTDLVLATFGSEWKSEA